MSQLRHNIGMRARALFFTIFGDKIDANFQAHSRSDPDVQTFSLQLAIAYSFHILMITINIKLQIINGISACVHNIYLFQPSSM